MKNNLIQLIKTKLNSNLGKDFLVTLISQSAIIILALVLNKILSIMLGVEGYGQYSIIKRSSSVISFVMLGGMGIALPRFYPFNMAKNDQRAAKSIIVATLIIVGLLIFVAFAILTVFSKQLSAFVVGNNNIPLYFATFLYATSITVCSWLYAYYRGVNSFINFGISQVSILLIMTISSLIFGKNLLQLLLTWSIFSFIYVFISLLIEEKKKKIFERSLKWKPDILPQFKTLLSYGMPRMVGDFFLFSLAAFPLLYINQKSGLVASSYFATGVTLTAIITPFFSFMGMILLPQVSAAVAQEKLHVAENLIKKLMAFYAILSLVFTFVLIIGMKWLILLFFSNDFLPAISVSKILALTILFESVYLLLRNPIDAVSHFPYNTVNLLISLTLLVMLFIFCDTLNEYAYSFLAVTALKAIISAITWHHCKKTKRGTV